ncbi:heat shock protein 70 [Senna tora]|uniref:Heat shock protein 70 n=1 Tax=Senna tora TaxID=362788 RepID=A0A834SY19_9FABA|nr:heat shock protein 70 [Senna tora]
MSRSGYTTTIDNLSAISVAVYEGERARVDDNHFLGKFVLPIPIARRGVADIKICFSIDGNGILDVTAEELKSGNKTNKIITNDEQRLSTEEIGRMVKEAEQYKTEDEEFKKMSEAKNALENYLLVSKMEELESVLNPIILKAKEKATMEDEAACGCGTSSSNASTGTKRNKMTTILKCSGLALRVGVSLLTLDLGHIASSLLDIKDLVCDDYS